MIDLKRVEELTSQFQEPSWLRDNRLKAWEEYLLTAMPSGKEETWRKVDLSALDLTKLRTFDLSAAEQVDNIPAMPSWFEEARGRFANSAGTLFQTTKNGGYLKLSKELSERGVIFCDLACAIEQHVDKIRPYLIQAFKHSKFNLLTRALYNCGAFLYIPRGVEVKEPFLIGLGFSGRADDIGAIFPRVIVACEDNAGVDVIFMMGPEADSVSSGDRVSLASVLVDVHVKGGARLNLLEVQQLGSDVFVVEDTTSHVMRDGHFNSLSVCMGASQTKADITTSLDGPGAASNVLGIIYGDSDGRFNFNTIQDHNAPDTTSNINYRVAIKDEASSVYQGIIRVDKSAQRTNAYQSNKNLILGGNARADSVPKLEILANDVKCSHGATVGPVDKDQVFYLQSRGMTATEAEELIVSGFFKKVIEEFPLAQGHEWIAEVVSRKVFGK